MEHSGAALTRIAQDMTTDAATPPIGAGTSEIRRMLIGRELFEATG